MPQTTTFSFCENFIERLMSYLQDNGHAASRDLSRLAVVFGGKRPALFLKRELARRIGRGFVPPRFFTIDEFMAYVAAKGGNFSRSRDLDLCYQIYQLARDLTPDVLGPRETFSDFLPWSRQILSFIDQLDLEAVPDRDLENIQDNARIGYAVPEDINRLLKSLVALRRAHHEQMSASRNYSRGYQYRQAAAAVAGAGFAEFEKILFCNFFYLNRSQETVIKNLYRRGQAELIFQGDERKWPVFRRIMKSFDCVIREGEQPDTPQFELNLYEAFDVHSQAAQVREILKAVPDPSKAVVVLPGAEHLIPLLTEISSVVKEFNVSMGYPLKRSSLFSLFELIFRAQLTRRDGTYYSRDYLKLLRHPLVKGLRLSETAGATRVLVHKTEEVLTGQYEGDVAGRLFAALPQIVASRQIARLASQTLGAMGSPVPLEQIAAMQERLHDLFFKRWEGLTCFKAFADCLSEWLTVLLRDSSLKRYPLNLRIAGKMFNIADEIRQLSFQEETFPTEEIFRIFRSGMEREIVAFTGSPLKGLQVLGLFETRSLNFEHVIMLDVNEGSMPKLNIYEPLIPREVMLSLNLDRLEQEEEIQRYQFMRLISAAKNVHLVYEKSRKKERSRFVEELIWEREKQAARVGGVPVRSPGFAVTADPRRKVIPKTPAVVDFLRAHRYSASSINTYLRSPLEFYYRYVLGLQEKEDLLDDPDNRRVGTFVHDFLEKMFKPFESRRPVLDAEFRKHFHKTLDADFSFVFGKNMQADAFLLKSVLDERLRRFLDNEEQNPERAVSELMFVEKRFEDVMDLTAGKIRFVYKLDRVDRLADGTVMILDYKTGLVVPMPKAIDRIEKMELSRQSVLAEVRSFQIPLYFMYLHKHFPDERINAAFYYLQTLEMPRFIDRKMTYDRHRIQKAFVRVLDFVVSEIVDVTVPFADD